MITSYSLSGFDDLNLGLKSAGKLTSEDRMFSVVWIISLSISKQVS